MRALAHHPDDRYPDAASLRDDLLGFARENDLLAFPKDLGDYVNAQVPPVPLVVREQSCIQDSPPGGAEEARSLRRVARSARLPSVMVDGEDLDTEAPGGTEPASPCSLRRGSPAAAGLPGDYDRTEPSAGLAGPAAQPPSSAGVADETPTPVVSVESYPEDSGRRRGRGWHARGERGHDLATHARAGHPRAGHPRADQRGLRAHRDDRPAPGGADRHCGGRGRPGRRGRGRPGGLGRARQPSGPAAGEGRPERGRADDDRRRRDQRARQPQPGHRLGRRCPALPLDAVPARRAAARPRASHHASRPRLYALGATPGADQQRAQAAAARRPLAGADRRPGRQARRRPRPRRRRQAREKGIRKAARNGAGRPVAKSVPGQKAGNEPSSGNVTTVDIDGPEPVLVVDVRPWAEVWVDGQKLGHTPMQKAVPPGPHKVELKNPELGFSKAYRIRSEPKKKVKISETLPEPGRRRRGQLTLAPYPADSGSK